ncbi:MAG: hypothetical protein JWM11_5522 [Planctomycetaceae bacterium]|nr:hypothetical protein [Planctomycetaceae bacterium]
MGWIRENLRNRLLTGTQVTHSPWLNAIWPRVEFLIHVICNHLPNSKRMLSRFQKQLLTRLPQLMIPLPNSVSSP